MNLEFVFFLLFEKNGSVGRWETKHFIGMALTENKRNVVVVMYDVMDIYVFLGKIGLNHPHYTSVLVNHIPTHQVGPKLCPPFASKSVESSVEKKHIIVRIHQIKNVKLMKFFRCS